MENKILDAIRAAFPNLKNIYPFIEELNKETPRGRVLISAGFLEDELKRILLAFMVEDKIADELVDRGDAPLGSFSARAKACYVLGLISEDEFSDLKLLRGVRNVFAHQVYASFKDSDVIKWCNKLKFRPTNYKKADGVPADQEAEYLFSTVSMWLITKLTNRADYVSKQRRSPANWPD